MESQRSPLDKSGLGYKEEATYAKEITSKKHEVSPSKKEDNVAKQPSTEEKNKEAILGTPEQRYESIFHGHCYPCNGYGHKGFECRSYERRYNGRFYNTTRCWICDQLCNTNLIGFTHSRCI